MTQPIQSLPGVDAVEADLAQLVYDDRTRRLIIDGALIARKRLFTTNISPEKVVQLHVHEPRADVVHAFARANYTPKWPVSYNYKGEDGNMVHFHYDPETYPALPFRQDHVRLYVDDYPEGTIGLACHSEANALVHRAAHLAEKTYDPAAGAARAADVLDAAGLDYETVGGDG